MVLLDASDASNSAWLAELVLVIVVGIYFAPGIVASRRGSRYVGPAWVINALLGWTLVGWAVAMALAVGERKTDVQRVAATPSPPSGSAPPTPTQPLVFSGTGFCPACGARVTGANFCGTCGTRLAQLMPGAPPAHES
jgi:hypothetical protein